VLELLARIYTDRGDAERARQLGDQARALRAPR
jgi:hypothetical protein